MFTNGDFLSISKWEDIRLLLSQKNARNWQGLEKLLQYVNESGASFKKAYAPAIERAVKEMLLLPEQAANLEMLKQSGGYLESLAKQVLFAKQVQAPAPAMGSAFTAALSNMIGNDDAAAKEREFGEAVGERAAAATASKPKKVKSSFTGRAKNENDDVLLSSDPESSLFKVTYEYAPGYNRSTGELMEKGFKSRPIYSRDFQSERNYCYGREGQKHVRQIDEFLRLGKTPSAVFGRGGLVMGRGFNGFVRNYTQIQEQAAGKLPEGGGRLIKAIIYFTPLEQETVNGPQDLEIFRYEER